MTPEEIVNDLLVKRNSANDDIDMMEAKQNAIEAIKQYAREMCDKQKWLIINDANYAEYDFLDKDDANDAPYPIELND